MLGQSEAATSLYRCLHGVCLNLYMAKHWCVFLSCLLGGRIPNLVQPTYRSCNPGDTKKCFSVYLVGAHHRIFIERFQQMKFDQNNIAGLYSWLWTSLNTMFGQT